MEQRICLAQDARPPVAPSPCGRVGCGRHPHTRSEQSPGVPLSWQPCPSCSCARAIRQWRARARPGTS